MKRRLKRWLGITFLLKRIVVLELAAKEAKDRAACQAKLIEGLEERIAQLEDARLPQKEARKPVQMKTWSQVQRILEQGEQINAG